MAILDKIRALTALDGKALPASRSVVSVTPQKKLRRSIRELFSRGEIEWSPDVERILALPRRPKPDLAALSAKWTARLKRPEGTQALWAHQAWLLEEAPLAGGVLGLLEPGAGKTLCGLLLPMVMPDCKRAVLLLPASLKAQLFENDWDEYKRHWKLPNLVGGTGFIEGRPSLKVIAYSELSDTGSTELLIQQRADLVMGDEVDALRNRARARTIRFLDFFAAVPDTRFAGWTASMTSDSPEDYAHLSALALGGGSPLPVDRKVVAEWSAAIGVESDGSILPGALSKLCEPGEDLQSAFQRRLVDTLGIIATEGSLISTKLVFIERKAPEMPQELKEAFQVLRRPPKDGGWRRPDKEELVDAMRVRECALEMMNGFYYRWVFPRGESKELKDEWFLRRQEYNRELRGRLMQAQPFMESPKLCENAASRYYFGGCSGCARGAFEDHQPGCKTARSQPLWDSLTWPAWHEIEDKVYHEQETVWISDYLLQDAVAWSKEQPGIIWVSHIAAGHRISALAGIPYFGGGDKANSEIIQEKGDRSIVVAINANKLGKNLQHAFWRNLILTIPASDTAIEQAAGRTHRPHQPKPVVIVEYYLHTPELVHSLDKARDRARYVFRTQGTQRKLQYAQFVKAS